uniref:TSA: Wollemia nobilis Ref_Wollemi_Transcript_5596_1249 transcribed RNA sequence n=1 Tax=Wollemia nobilis TaxID=56998 RepID=A0A0C9QVK5_9CONI
MDEEMQGFVDLWKCMFGFMDSLGLRWAADLEIPDIIARGGLQSALTVDEIASHLPSTSPNVDFLSRILSFLAMRGIFTQAVHGNQVKYGLSPMSKWLVKNRAEGDSMNAMVLVQTHEAVIAPWYRFRDCMLGCGLPFEVANGKPLFSFAKENPDFGRLFKAAMVSHSKMPMKHILSVYGDGFKGLTSLVDVGGGNGSSISKIAEAFPHIKCYNYDLPQVIRDAPTYNGVEHIEGDFFLSVPQANAIFMKLILHDWGDEECIKILRNCRRAIPKQGKLIVVDGVLADPGKEKEGFEDIARMMDMVMLANVTGKQRREDQWRELLQAGGFGSYNIIHLPSQMSIIEAFPS